MSAVPAAVPAPALELDELEVSFTVRGQWRRALRGVSLAIAPGEAYGLVGESGCGKSTTALAVMRHLPRNGRVTGGGIRVSGADLLAMSEREVRRYRAQSASMVYQNPGAALNPSLRVGDQVLEAFTAAGVPAAEARGRTLDLLARVQIADPESVMRRYPHQLSGGMLQRALIAMALASDPALLVLDEPTTGLDATVEAEVLDLVAGLRAELGTSVLFISHNLAVVRHMCDRVGVLYAGRLVEEGPAGELFRDPCHPYTVGLLRCLPRSGIRKDERRLDTIPGVLPAPGAELAGCVFADRCGLVRDVCRREEPPLHAAGPGRTSRCHFWQEAAGLPHTAASPRTTASGTAAGAGPVLAVADAAKTFRQDGHGVRALAGVTLGVAPGETLGLVGESGSGKTTLARVLLGLTPPDGGTVVELDGRPLAAGLGSRSTEEVRALQIVFQNPDSALNRRFAARRIVGRALTKLLGLRGSRREERVRELARAVRFDERLLAARPAQLSGGLKQRVAIARAFAGDPRVVVCDEPTSALDVSVQAAILNLLVDLQEEQGVSYLFISHDLGVVRYLADRIAVLYLGRLMEVGDAATVLAAPHHPYTEALLSAVPALEGEERTRIRLEGEIPSAAEPPSGCVFHTRCPRKLGEICEQEEPPLAEAEPGHALRCHIPLEDLRRLQAAPPAGPAPPS
ncbi:MAG TPA: ABC transporter ATP-binding protein [Gaiellaceae bacterium]|nr:ABC transporter ATP-binding protein [Gaiellaceae bacterium]